MTQLASVLLGPPGHGHTCSCPEDSGVKTDPGVSRNLPRKFSPGSAAMAGLTALAIPDVDPQTALWPVVLRDHAEISRQEGRSFGSEGDRRLPQDLMLEDRTGAREPLPDLHRYLRSQGNNPRRYLETK